MTIIILVAALVCAVAFVVLSIMIAHQVAKRGVKINILFLRFFIIKYAHQYKILTKEETGKTGPLFYPWIFSVNAALVLVLAYLFLMVV